MFLSSSNVTFADTPLAIETSFLSSNLKSPVPLSVISAAPFSETVSEIVMLMNDPPAAKSTLSLPPPPMTVFLALLLLANTKNPSSSE